jgi:tRNA dimethylallyltransferase
MPKDLAIFHTAIYLTGPTGVGKTEISLRLAERLGAEILALDAMTLYRHMDIGTAKPTKQERDRIAHHLIDLIEPTESSNLESYLNNARTVLKDLAERRIPAIFVGGSPLYLKACLRGLSELPTCDQAVRERLSCEALEKGVEWLHRRLADVDPESASRIATADLLRIIRCLEIFEVSGLPPSRLRTLHDQPAPESTPVFALIRDRNELYHRINKRVDQMFETGLLEEAKNLPAPLSLTASQAVGYQEALSVLDGACSELEARERVKLRTRHYAKHQLTWFRRLQEVRGLMIQDLSVESAVELLIRRIEDVRNGSMTKSDPIL